MNLNLLEILVCPYSKKKLTLNSAEYDNGRIKSGNLVSEEHTYPVINYIPRFVNAENYASNFGFQWNKFAKTQLDSYSGFPISSDRFWKATGWKPEELKDQWVLDLGCGSGRFAEIALKAGAKVVALDYSSAVDACYENLKMYDNLYVVQGDIYSLPFNVGSFQFVYSLGVLQHTPNVKKAFESIPPMVALGGKLCVDYYWKRFQTVMHAKYLFRPFTKRMQKDRLFKMLERYVPFMLFLSKTIGKLPFVGKILKRVIPVADYTGIYPLSSKQLSEWALLDTFDMLGPQYDSPQTKKIIYKWMSDAGMQDIQILHETLLVSRGIKG